MPQYDFQIADYERIFRKRYRIVVLAVILAVGFSVMFAKMKPPIYSATSTVKVDRSSVIGLGMESVVYGTWDNIETQTKVITSVPVLLEAAKRLYPALVSDSMTEDRCRADERVLSILEGIRAKVNAASSSGTNIIRITATAGRPREARDVANAMAYAYKDFSLGGKRLHAGKTKTFVEEQLHQCQADLSEVEHELRRFEETQRIPSIDANARRVIDESSRLTRELETLDESIEVVRSQGRKLADRLKSGDLTGRNVKSAEGQVDTSATAGQMGWVSQFADLDPGVRQLNDRLINLQVSLNDLRAHYKDGHPLVVSTEDRIRGTIREILSEYQKKLRAISDKREKLGKEKAVVDRELQMLPANEMQYARLMRRMKVKEELYTLLTKKLQEAMIAEAGAVDDVTILSMATMPSSATNKNVARVAGVGVFLGLIFGIIFAIIREMFDTSIGTIEDVERALKLPVLAVIPHIHPEEERGRGSKKKANTASQSLRSFLVTHFNSKDPTAEAYRILRTNIEYLSFEKPLKTILVTSATMQEGKSTTITNLAIAFAQQGKKVMLLECNLRRPSHQKIFGTDKGVGTADILIDKVRWQNCVRTVTDLALGEFTMEEILAIPGLDNLNSITYGHRPPNPTELLSSDKMERLLSDLRDNYDIVLVDAPPLLPVADSMVLSTKVDGVALVYKVGKAPRNSLQLAKERLETVQANILGVVLNDIRPETTGLTYSSYYMYAYGKEQGTEKKRGRRRHRHTTAEPV